MSKEDPRNRQLSKGNSNARSRWLVNLEVLAVAVYSVLLAGLLFRIGAAAQNASAWLVFAGSLPLAYLFADFASGLVHWFCDTFFEEDTPVLGDALIRPFREHHRDPKGITKHGFFELNGNNSLAMIPLLVLAWWTNGPAAGSTMSLFAYSLLFNFALAIFATNQFHKWAHAASVPRIVRWLQRARLILPPTVHDIHHRGNYSRSYCITTGWMNQALDFLVRFHRVKKPATQFPS